MGKHHLNAKRIIIIIINLKQVFKSFTEFSKSFLPSHQIAMIPSHKVSTRLFIPMSSLDEDQFTSGDRRGPANSARKSAATKPRSRAHARANRFPMRFYLIAVCVVLLQCHPVCAVGHPSCPTCNGTGELVVIICCNNPVCQCVAGRETKVACGCCKGRGTCSRKRIKEYKEE